MTFHPDLDLAFKQALLQGNDALTKLYTSEAWTSFTRDFSHVIIQDLVVENCTLEDIVFNKLILDGAIFRNVTLRNPRFPGSEMHQGVFDNVRFEPIYTQQATDIWNQGYVDVQYCQWNKVSFTHCDLRFWLLGGGTYVNITTEDVHLPPTRQELAELLRTGRMREFDQRYREACDPADQLNLHGQNLAHVDFRKANLPECDFSYANLQGANFENKNLALTDFICSDLRGANFRNATLGSLFYGADLRGADLAGASTYEVNTKDTDHPYKYNVCKFYEAKLDPDARQRYQLIDLQFEPPAKNYHDFEPAVAAWDGFDS